MNSVPHIGSPQAPSAEMWDKIHEKYIVGDLVNEGRDGTIIRFAVERTRGRELALKVVPAATQKNRDRAIKEAYTLGKLKHENIVECFAMYESEDEVILVLEYCRSGDLLDRVNGHGKFNEQKAKEMFIQIVDALAHCYNNGYAHRDVKLDNVFIQRDETNRKETLKLADFGFSDVYFPGIPYRRSCGTLAYAAPELLLPHSRICYDGELADVWSCGVVLYALLQGLLPFRAPSDTELVRKIHQGEFSMPEGLTPTAQELLRCLLSVDPTKRPRFSELQKHPWLSRERPDDEPAPSRSSAPRTRLARFRGSSFFSRFRDRSLSGNPNSSPHGTTLHANSSPSDRKKKGKESIDSASSARVTQGSSRRESDVAISRKQKRSSSVFRRLISPIVSKLRS